jgi:hypothetical protein
VGNWKSEENIKYFKENSFEALAKDFLERGYDFYVDGFAPKPIFIVSMIKKDDNSNWSLIKLREIETTTLQCKIIEFANYKEMISILEEMGKDNYIFMHAIKPFQMRVSTISCRYDIPGVEHIKTRLREQKINELLNE